MLKLKFSNLVTLLIKYYIFAFVQEGICCILIIAMHIHTECMTLPGRHTCVPHPAAAGITVLHAEAERLHAIHTVTSLLHTCFYLLPYSTLATRIK